MPGISGLHAGVSPAALDVAAVLLRGDAAALRRARRPRRVALLGALERRAHDQDQLGLGIVAVLELIARLGRRDDQRAVAGEARAQPLDEPRAIDVAQRG